MAEKKEVITAVYKVNLHCPQCAREIKKPLLKTQGVHSVDVDVEKGEIKVKGVIEVEKIQKQIAKWSKKKVALISKVAHVAEKKTTEVKKETIHTTVIKVHMHCPVCENDFKKKLRKHKGIHNVKTDRKAQTLTVQGTIEPTKLLAYIRKKVHKHAEIISSKTDSKEEEKKKKEGEEKKKKEGEEKKGDEKKKKEGDEKKKKEGEEKKGDEKKKKEGEEKKEKEEEEKKKKKEGAAKADETKTTDVVEFKEEVKVVVKDKDGTTPYFIHYVYAPQLFSDENPNACSIM